jgi:hypothetical protein
MRWPTTVPRVPGTPMPLQKWREAIVKHHGEEPSTGGFYIGDRASDGGWKEGAWRVVLDGNDLSFERYESGSWVQKGDVSAV